MYNTCIDNILYLYLLEVNGFAYDLVVLGQLLASG